MAVANQSSREWHLLPPDLLELQIGQIDLLLAMYPEEATIEESSQKTLDHLRQATEHEGVDFDGVPNVSVLLRILIDNHLVHHEALQLSLTFPFTVVDDVASHDPPPAKIRAQQPSWLSRVATAQIICEVEDGEDLFSTLEHIKEQAIVQLELSNSATVARASEANASEQAGPLVRVWFYFPSISTRSKRDDFIKYAPSYHLTGFLYAGKPGLLCVEGDSQNIDDYMKFIKTESWGDIPSHHKKVSERHRERIEERAFSNMTETTNTLGERHGQRANRGDMKAMEDWLIERGLGDAFTKVLM
ncbi:hypothetical protein T440DRAFT_447614 [Plenodomus tracheiphilus IPT5]|uniref:Small nuclear ribonucleoprotein Prp3 C-terminal domain-containing protein n=1 Tax=Plenodomus tracheiphilus IPT5 TaxID=1408161 RepID=A0A6A7BCH6_9PLEO|nr:hypothetical protein T440DRAFT_447614 [Plenodomus tracheiphilus IPT5]